MWYRILWPFARRAAEGAAGMAGALLLKHAAESETAARLAGSLADEWPDLGIRFNPLNLTDPFGTQAEADEARYAAERKQAQRDLDKARKDAAAREKAAQKSGNVQAQQAAAMAKLEAELAFQQKLSQLERANEARYRDATRRGDKATQQAAFEAQKRADVAKKLAEAESQLKLVAMKKESEGSDIGRLKWLLDLMNAIKGMTVTGADVPKFNAAQVSADLDMALSPRESDVDSFLRYEGVTPEDAAMSGPFYRVENVAVREV